MKTEMKKLLKAASLLLSLALFGGGALFFFVLLGMLGMFPLYVTCGGTALGAAGLLAVFLLGCGYLPGKAHRGVKAVFLCVLLACGVYMGHGAWRDSLPTVDDRERLLWQYEPYSEDTEAVYLDEPSALRLDRRALPRLDGATALYPVYAGFVQAVYPEGEYPRYDGISADGNGTVACTGTVEAYQRLIRGEADVVFAAAPSQAQLDAAQRAGVELHLTPIGREAFVFFVNSKNPVEGLTVEEIQGIYTGEITNWKEVGGKNQSIRPFQRMEDSGSQSALRRLMDGLPLMEPEKEDRIEGMGGIITQVASYRNYRNALGFSFRFYATEMVENNDIRLLALNGVAPTRETIRDGSYPISSEFYAVTAASIGEPDPRETNADLDAFLTWMVSDQGQEIVERTGYVSLG